MIAPIPKYWRLGSSNSGAKAPLAPTAVTATLSYLPMTATLSEENSVET